MYLVFASIVYCLVKLVIKNARNKVKGINTLFSLKPKNPWWIQIIGNIIVLIKLNGKVMGSLSRGLFCPCD
jgi:hypothetical protein